MEMSFDYVRFVSATYEDEWDDEVPFWGPVQKDVDEHELASSYIGDDRKLIEFLKLFFSEEVVQRVQDTLEFTKNSVLGGQYAKRGVYSSFVKKVISDIIEAHRNSESSQTDSDDWIGLPCLEERIEVEHASGDDTGGEWTAVESKRRRPSVASSGGGRAGRSSATGAGTSTTGVGTSSAARVSSVTTEDGGPGRGRGGGRGGRRGARLGPGHGTGAGRDTRRLTSFSCVPVLYIKLSSWQSPEKAISGSIEEKLKRRQTLKQRSEEFIKHPLLKSVGEREYSPEDVEHRMVTFFHGTRSNNLVTFKKYGISPRWRMNEFSRGPCFYVSNSLKTAFEHPLHVHPSLGKNPVTVFGFTVNTGVLHGELSPPTGSCFVVKWFENPDEEWEEFCRQNYCDSRDVSSKYDIVIGPVCIPTSKFRPDFEALKVDEKVVQQIAFPTSRGQLWLEDNLSHILQEVRPDL